MNDPREYDLEADVTEKHYEPDTDGLSDQDADEYNALQEKSGYWDHLETWGYEQSLDQFEEDERDEFGERIYPQY